VDLLVISAVPMRPYGARERECMLIASSIPSLLRNSVRHFRLVDQSPSEQAHSWRDKSCSAYACR